MAPDFRTVTVDMPQGSRSEMTLDIPSVWDAVEDPGPVLAAFSDSRALSPGIASNVVITGTELPSGTELEGWQQVAREAQVSSLPDLQVLDDRRLDATDGSDQWYTSSAMTDQNGITVFTRRWSRLVPGIGLTLTLTTLPLVDAEHAEVFDAIADSWTLTVTQEIGADDDQA